MRIMRTLIRKNYQFLKLLYYPNFLIKHITFNYLKYFLQSTIFGYLYKYKSNYVPKIHLQRLSWRNRHQRCHVAKA